MTCGAAAPESRGFPVAADHGERDRSERRRIDYSGETPRETCDSDEEPDLQSLIRVPINGMLASVLCDPGAMDSMISVEFFNRHPVLRELPFLPLKYEMADLHEK